MTFEYDVETLGDNDETETVTFHLNDPKDLPVGILRRNRRDELGLTFSALEWALPADELDAFDKLTLTEVLKLSQAWQESENEEQDKPRKGAKPKTPRSTEG